MNLGFVFLLLFVLGIEVVDGNLNPQCEEQNVGYFYIGDKQKAFHVPNGNLDHKKELPLKNLFTNSFAYDPSSKELLMAQYKRPEIISFNIPNQQLKAYELHSKIISSFSRDPLTGNIYCISSDGLISVCDLLKKKCHELISNNDNMHRMDLVLHPKRAQMFWIEGTPENDSNEFVPENVTLKMANFNGRNIQTIATTTNNWKVGLTVDSANDLLYFAHQDSLDRQPRIDRINLLTMKQSVFSETSVFSLNYFDCKLFCLHMVNHAEFAYVYHMDGRNESLGHMLTPFSLPVASESPNEKLLNPCSITKCDGICVPVETKHGLDTQCLNDKQKTFGIKVIEMEQEEGAFFSWIPVLATALMSLITVNGIWFRVLA